MQRHAQPLRETACRGEPDPQPGEGSRPHADRDRGHVVPARASPLEQLGECRQQLGGVRGRVEQPLRVGRRRADRLPGWWDHTCDRHDH